MGSDKKRDQKSCTKKTNKTELKHSIPGEVLEKQMLIDLEKRLSLNVGNYLVLSEEGDPSQIAFAHQKARTEFLKFGPEMSKLARSIGGEILVVVADFLESIDLILHCNGMLDEEKIAQCFQTTQRLQAELKI